MKVDVLASVADHGEAEALEVVAALGFTYQAAAMALLRAYRSGLLARIGTPGQEAFRYALTDKGRQRLEYIGGTRQHTVRSPKSVLLNSRSGDPDMRMKKLYSGLYHCPEYVYEDAHLGALPKVPRLRWAALRGRAP
ncbi:MAG TPA: hypothetical protein VJX92_03635 [Methylomirabilota bacterium]|nr:hypothetical protein [Methylomirabilota bacterium]